MNFKFLYALVLFVCCISCHSKDQGADKTGMEFHVDSTQLSQVVRIPDHQVQYCPPAGWEAVDIDVFKERIGSSASDSFNHILEVYKDSGQTAFLIVSGLNQKTATTPAAHPDSISRFGKQPWQDVRRGDFEHQGLSFTQYLLQSSQWVSFRLFVGETEPKVRFDFIVSRVIYQNEIRKIESSIGSISKLKLFN